MTRWWVSGLLAALCACAQSNSPAAGSQTHFLASCDDSCPAPYACLCGVCTLACSGDGACTDAPVAAECVAPAGAAQCGGAANVCDVECSEDVACAALGADFACVQGRCRVEPGSGTIGTVLCDGSDAIRFGMTSAGGQVDTSYEFTNPYGHAYLFVDGHCRYYASRDAVQGVRTGMLSESQAQQLATGIGYASIETWSAIPDEDSCPDAGIATLWKPGAFAYCTCGCPDGPFMEAETAAFQQMYPWIEMLVMAGEELTGPVAAIAVDNGAAMAMEPTWPLATPMLDVPQLVQDIIANGVGAPALFDVPADAATLRMLRAQATTVGAQLIVRDAGVRYNLHLRDELPADVVQGIAVLRGGQQP